MLGVGHTDAYRVYSDVVRGMGVKQSVRGWAHRLLSCVSGCC